MNLFKQLWASDDLLAIKESVLLYNNKLINHQAKVTLN